MKRQALLAICLVALLHATLFIVYQRPDWDVAWTDQEGYQRLGEVLAQTGRFTRYPGYSVFVPEVIRTPGYPAFVAVVYKIAGVRHLPVAVAQAGIFAAICMVVYGIARRVASEQVALAAAAVTALFPPLPYYGALVLTEVWTTLVLSLALLACLRATATGRIPTFALAGLLFGCATLIRPAFVLLPFGLAIGMPLLVPAERRTQHRLAGWAALAVTGGLTLLPWLTYNYQYLGQFTLSPAGGVGRGLWEGSWQGRWPGRVHAQLTAIADEEIPRDALDARVRVVAADSRVEAGPMLAYVHEWRDIRRIWEDPVDPIERARARIVADQEYLRAARRHIGEDPIGFVRRHVTRGLFALWASDIPIRYTDINATPPWIIRAMWLAQVALLLAALLGLAATVQQGRLSEAALLALPLLYVTAVHLPLLCETRQSLPVKPIVLVLATIGVAWLARRRGATSPGSAAS
jgi:hypothetical protein